MNINGIPVHLMVLKGGENQSGSNVWYGSAKWLGFAKSLAWNCLQRSKKSHSWVSETKKLPREADTETDKLMFVLVKCHADQKLCFIVVRDGEGSLPHGIITTPCSPISPQGFGYPYVASGAADWGTPGFDGASWLYLADYSGASGGTAWQALMVDATQDPAIPEKHLVYGPDWGKIVGTARATKNGYWSDLVYGGSLAATGTLADGDKVGGYFNSASKKPVFSVKGLPTGWLQQANSVKELLEIDRNRQATKTIGLDMGGGVAVINWGTCEPSTVFKSGKPLNLTANVTTLEGADGRVKTVDTTSFVGVGVLNTESTKQRLVLVARIYDSTLGVFKGDYALAYSDAPYKNVVFSQAFKLDYSINQVYFTGSFQFDQSCTRASAVLFGAKLRDGRDVDGGTITALVVEPEVVHLNINGGGAGCSVVVEENPGCVYRRSNSTSNADSAQGPAEGGTSYVHTSSQTVTIGPYAPTLAIGYDGDTEKRLTMSYSYNGYSEEISSSIYSDVGRIIQSNGQLVPGTWFPLHRSSQGSDTASQTLSYAINGTAVGGVSCNSEGSYQYGTSWDIGMHGYPPPTYPSAESVKDAWVAYAATYGNPVEWATGRWDYALIQNAYPPDCYRLQLTRDGSETQPPPYQMMGWYLPGCASQGTIYGSTIINPQPTSINQGTKISSQIYANLYAVDLINEKLWYSTQKVTTTGVPIGLGDFEYSSSIELKIMCNDTVLLSEISSG